MLPRRTDVGIDALARALEVLGCSVNAMYLSSNQISSKGVICLANSLKKNKNALTIDISDNKLVSRAGVAAFVDAKVHLDYLLLKMFKVNAQGISATVFILSSTATYTCSFHALLVASHFFSFAPAACRKYRC